MLSRVADALYWMSRYLERAEHTARLLDLELHMMLEQKSDAEEERWTRILASLYVTQPPGLNPDVYTLTQLLTFENANTNSITTCIAGARENARHVREQISSEMWEQVNRLSLQVKNTQLETIWDDQPHKTTVMVVIGFIISWVLSLVILLAFRKRATIELGAR